ncbi:MAG: M23 family metallopeptidase [Candidatus Omnitrophica bacterium]|nr:M23 family metallopeptidase [Candidatus Omnitrophota bacterium]
MAHILIRPGENIAKGAIIATMPASAQNNFLHFEIRKGALAQNPHFYLPN